MEKRTQFTKFFAIREARARRAVDADAALGSHRAVGCQDAPVGAMLEAARLLRWQPDGDGLVYVRPGEPDIQILDGSDAAFAHHLR